MMTKEEAAVLDRLAELSEPMTKIDVELANGLVFRCFPSKYGGGDEIVIVDGSGNDQYVPGYTFKLAPEMQELIDLGFVLEVALRDIVDIVIVNDEDEEEQVESEPSRQTA